MTEDLTHHTRAAAKAIAGDKPPSDWLIGAAQRMVDFVISGTVATEIQEPFRKDIIRRIKLLRRAVMFVQNEFYDMSWHPEAIFPKVLPLRKFMLSPNAHSDELDGQLWRNLHLLVAKCDESLEAMPAKGGRGHALPKGVSEQTASGGVMCAIAVTLLWKNEHNRLPAIDSPKAWEACVEFWRASGGGQSRGPGSSWRVDLGKARKKGYHYQETVLEQMLGVKGIPVSKRVD